ncbi:hypothetical protein [Rosistilla oblonga]|uniref:hypothetical protein n=1 Tax=Rosistilla oblonga TaxID=2527990 RepID=UPI003A96ED52
MDNRLDELPKTFGWDGERYLLRRACRRQDLVHGIAPFETDVEVIPAANVAFSPEKKSAGREPPIKQIDRLGTQLGQSVRRVSELAVLKSQRRDPAPVAGSCCKA